MIHNKLTGQYQCRVRRKMKQPLSSARSIQHLICKHCGAGPWVASLALEAFRMFCGSRGFYACQWYFPYLPLHLWYKVYNVGRIDRSARCTRGYPFSCYWISLLLAKNFELAVELAGQRRLSKSQSECLRVFSCHVMAMPTSKGHFERKFKIFKGPLVQQTL